MRTINLTFLSFFLAIVAAYSFNYKKKMLNGRTVYTYYAKRTTLGGSSFVWLDTIPSFKSCGVRSGLNASCTITTTVAPWTIANYNSRYPSLWGRAAYPSIPTSKSYTF
jgi:hypothetical protein